MFKRVFLFVTVFTVLFLLSGCQSVTSGEGQKAAVLVDDVNGENVLLVQIDDKIFVADMSDIQAFSEAGVESISIEAKGSDAFSSAYQKAGMDLPNVKAAVIITTNSNTKLPEKFK